MNNDLKYFLRGFGCAAAVAATVALLLWRYGGGK